MKSDNYVVIQGWMCNELNLKGNELLVFALIYGFCQDGTTHFTGSRGYIADTFNITLPTVDKALKGLKDQQLIEVYKDSNNNCTYKVSLQEGVKKLYKGCKETLHNNTNNITNNHNNKSISKDIDTDFEFGYSKKSKAKKPSLYDKCVSMINDFTTDTILGKKLVDALKLFLENSREANTPFYSNHFKGKLNALSKLSDDTITQRKIVQQTLDNGWNNFYELKTDKRKSNNTHDRLNESGDLYVEHSDKRKEIEKFGNEKY